MDIYCMSMRRRQKYMWQNRQVEDCQGQTIVEYEHSFLFLDFSKFTIIIPSD
jgi:hypothetical protein